MSSEPLILSTVDNRDGTHTVTVATVTHGQAQVTVPTSALYAPETVELYRHAADIGGSPYAADRRSRRDRIRHATMEREQHGQ